MKRPGRRMKNAAGVAVCVLAVAGVFLAARHLTSTSWPLQEANIVLVIGASFFVYRRCRSQAALTPAPRG